MEEKIKIEALLEEVKLAIKDLFISAVRKTEDGLQMKFPNGQIFTIAIWEDKK